MLSRLLNVCGFVLFFSVFFFFPVQLNQSFVSVSHEDRLGGFMLMFIPIVQVRVRTLP